MFARLNDVFVGVIAGAVCSVAAAGFEAVVVTLRFFSVGHIGGGVGSKFVVVAVLGAVVGGAIGFTVGALMKTRERGSAL